MTWAASVIGMRDDIVDDLRRAVAPQRVQQTILGREVIDLQVDAVAKILEAVPKGNAVEVNLSGHCSLTTIGNCMLSVRTPEP